MQHNSSVFAYQNRNLEMMTVKVFFFVFFFFVMHLFNCYQFFLFYCFLFVCFCFFAKKEDSIEVSRSLGNRTEHSMLIGTVERGGESQLEPPPDVQQHDFLGQAERGSDGKH